MFTRSVIDNFDQCEVSFDDLVIFSVQLDDIVFKWPVQTIPMPEWLTAKAQEVQVELKARILAEKRRELRRLRAEERTYVPKEEQRAEIRMKIAELEKELANS